MTVVQDAAAAVRDADVVITMLTDGPTVIEVVRAARLHGSATLVDMSTIGPDAVRDLAAVLPGGVDLVDAPVAGSTGAAEGGTLRIFAGGTDAALDRVAPVLATLGEVRRCGPSGSGAAMKVVLNTALVTALASLAEVLQVADAVGGAGVGGPGVAARRAARHRRGTRPGGQVGALRGAARGEGPRPQHRRPGPAGGRRRRAAPGRRRPGGGPDHHRSGRTSMLVIDNPAAVAAPVGAYSHVARVDVGTGTLLFLSGQIALDDDGSRRAGNMVAQATRVFELIGAILEAHGATFADVVNIRTFLTDMALLPQYGQVRLAVFTGRPPTSTTVEVSRLFRDGALLEVEVVAAVAS